MNAERTPQKPSPLAGEGASRARSVREAGEGQRGAADGPSPGRSLRSRPPSPARREGESRRLIGKSSVDPEMRRRARELRTRMTDAERKLWFALRDRRFAEFKFRRQVPIGRFIADFICFERRLVIEVDGGQDADSVSDQRRDRWLVTNGYRVLRFWNNEVLSNLEGVMTLLGETLDVKEWP
jgi:very-short-patch-repair endonuclease